MFCSPWCQKFAASSSYDGNNGSKRLGKCDSQQSSQGGGAFRDGGRYSGGGWKRLGANEAEEVIDVFCSSFFQKFGASSSYDGNNGSEQLGKCVSRPPPTGEGVDHDGGQYSGGGVATGQGEERGERYDVGCEALFLDPPSSYLFDSEVEGGGERVSYCHPSSRLECASDNSGYNGGVLPITTGQGEEREECYDVGCEALFLDPSPSSDSFDDGNNGGGERVSYRHPSS